MTYLEDAQKLQKQKRNNNVHRSPPLQRSRSQNCRKHHSKTLRLLPRDTVRQAILDRRLQWKKLNLRKKFWEKDRHLLQFRNAAKVARGVRPSFRLGRRGSQSASRRLESVMLKVSQPQLNLIILSKADAKKNASKLAIKKKELKELI